MLVTTACCDLLKELNSSPLTQFKPSSVSLRTWNGLLTCPRAKLSFGPEIPHYYMKGKRERKIIYVASEQQCIYWWFWVGIVMKEQSLFILGLKHKEGDTLPRGDEDMNRQRKTWLVGFVASTLSISFCLSHSLWSYSILFCFTGAGSFLVCYMNEPVLLAVHRLTSCVSRCRILGCHRAPFFMLKLSLLYLYSQTLHLAFWWECQFRNRFLDLGFMLAQIFIFLKLQFSFSV